MSDDKTVTEREAVLRERAAFARGAQWAWYNNYAQCAGAKFNHDGYVDGRAADHYPLPTITRLREVPDPEPRYTHKWRVSDGQLEYYSELTGEWHPAHSGATALVGCERPTPARIKLWFDLLANPTEEVTE